MYEPSSLQFRHFASAAAAIAAQQSAAASANGASSSLSSAMKTGGLTVFDTQLSKLYTHAVSPSASSLAGAVETVGGVSYITVDITAKNGDGASLLPALTSAGLVHGESFAGIVSGQISLTDLDALRGALAGASAGRSDDLGFARVSASMTHVGLVTSQADTAEHAAGARASFGVDGTGLKVGVLSDSFDTNATAATHMADDIANGDLPTNTTVLEDLPDGSDEGRAMAQLVHDIAPGASIEFATAFAGEADFANNILKLAADGAKVIVDDVIYFDELAYQDGPVAQAVSQVVSQGVNYFSSAGNDSNLPLVTGYEGAWKAGGKYFGGGETTTLMQFAPGQDYLKVHLTGGEIFDLQWSNPGAAAGGKGATADLDLFLTNADGSVVYTLSNASNIGGDPVEVIAAYDDATGDPLAPGTYYLRVGRFEGPAPAEIKLMALGNGADVSFDSPASNTNTGTFFGHAATVGASAVGAAFYGETPEYGTSPALPEYYTSSGPDNILFDVNGNKLATPQQRTVSMTAVDGVDNTFLGFPIHFDQNTFPNFFGTSAAAPDAAAVAALMLQANAGLTTADVRSLLMDSASDMDAAGFDNLTGAGLIDARRAVSYAAGQTIANTGQSVLTGTHLNDVISGDASSNVINGLAGNDGLRGGAGNDMINGGLGSDRISGDAGDDILTGGPGGDVFVFGPGFGNDVITDFAPSGGGHDLMQISKTVFANFAAVHSHTAQVGADVVITLDPTDSITLKGVSMASLTASDFLFT